VTLDHADPQARASWRQVALPKEHGGWGLTAEPVLLGLLIAFSWTGLAIGAAALLVFLARTPLKLVAVDHRRGRRLERDRLARRVANAEIGFVVVLVVLAVSSAGARWLVPVAVALPFVAVQLSYDVRSRSRRLIPELCGAVGVSATAAAIIVAGSGSSRLAAAAWLVLAGRVIASIPFVRVQIQRFRHGETALGQADALQVVALAVAAAAVVVDTSVVLGACAVGIMAIAQAIGMRRTPISPAVRIGVVQTLAGASVVVATALGVLKLS
jgi:hypothetical protein